MSPRFFQSSEYAIRSLFCVLFLIGITLFEAQPASGQADSALSVDSPEYTAQVNLGQAKALFEQNQLEESLSLIEDLIEQSPQSPHLDQAYFLEAAVLRALGQDNQATISLEHLIHEFPTSPLLDDARLILGALYLGTDQSDRALEVLNDSLILSSDPATHREARHLMREVYERNGDFPKAIQITLSEIDQADELERRDLQDYIQSVILQRMDEPALRDLLELFPLQYPGDLAMIRLNELHMAQEDEVLAERDIRLFLRRFPNHPYAQTAMALLQSFIAKIKAHDHVVAAVLPFSGRLNPYGNDSLNGIRLALEDAKDIFPLNTVGLVLKEDDYPPTAIQHEIYQMLEEFKPIAVIGPMRSREVQILAPIPDQVEIPFITPSATLHDVRQFGQFWFSTALTSALQVQGLVDYAFRELQYQRFCILYPQSAYGRELGYQFQKAVEDRGGEIVGIESYPRRTTDATKQILRLKEADLENYGELITITPDETDEAAKTREVYFPGFDAVFLPGLPEEVAFIAAQLAFYDVKVSLLGTNGWNSPNLIKWGGSSMEGSIFSDGLFLKSPDFELQQFHKKYQNRFNTNPSVFALQAYDAMRLVLDTIRHGATSGTEVRDQLIQRDNLPTLDGFTSFGSGGVLNRKIFLIRVEKRQFQRIN